MCWHGLQLIIQLRQLNGNSSQSDNESGLCCQSNLFCSVVVILGQFEHAHRLLPPNYYLKYFSQV